MEYYLELARQQWERFKLFADARPLQDTIEIRQEFFSRRYEANIAKTIIEGISECEKYNEHHPVKP